ncbi:MAG: F0F1 ATP synthase subunit epsilon [Holophagae bacterium]|jgi:F-type H+-transporting ATPase subunit epsilon
MAETLRLEVVTPAQRVLEGRASEVRIPGADGELGILPGHTPLLTALGTGQVRYTDGGTSGLLVVQGGFAEVQPDAVTVLASVAETVDEIDLDAARAALSEAEEALKDASAEDFPSLDAQARLAAARIEASSE